MIRQTTVAALQEPELAKDCHDCGDTDTEPNMYLVMRDGKRVWLCDRCYWDS